jgi:hypothetical protein
MHGKQQSCIKGAYARWIWRFTTKTPPLQWNPPFGTICFKLSGIDKLPRKNCPRLNLVSSKKDQAQALEVHG